MQLYTITDTYSSGNPKMAQCTICKEEVYYKCVSSEDDYFKGIHYHLTTKHPNECFKCATPGCLSPLHASETWLKEHQCSFRVEEVKDTEVPAAKTTPPSKEVKNHLVVMLDYFKGTVYHLTPKIEEPAAKKQKITEETITVSKQFIKELGACVEQIHKAKMRVQTANMAGKLDPEIMDDLYMEMSQIDSQCRTVMSKLREKIGLGVESPEDKEQEKEVDYFKGTVYHLSELKQHHEKPVAKKQKTEEKTIAVPKEFIRVLAFNIKRMHEASVSQRADIMYMADICGLKSKHIEAMTGQFDMIDSHCRTMMSNLREATGVGCDLPEEAKEDEKEEEDKEDDAQSVEY